MLKTLILEASELNGADLHSLQFANAKGNLPAIKHLSLAGNPLARQLWWFFSSDKKLYKIYPAQGWNCLETLILEASEMTVQDLCALKLANAMGMLPAIKHLGLARNLIAGLLCSLLLYSDFKTYPAHGWNRLEILEWPDCIESDARCLLNAVGLHKLPNLKTLQVERWLPDKEAEYYSSYTRPCRCQIKHLVRYRVKLVEAYPKSIRTEKHSCQNRFCLRPPPIPQIPPDYQSSSIEST